MLRLLNETSFLMEEILTHFDIAMYDLWIFALKLWQDMYNGTYHLY